MAIASRTFEQRLLSSLTVKCLLLRAKNLVSELQIAVATCVATRVCTIQDVM